METFEESNVYATAINRLPGIRKAIILYVKEAAQRYSGDELLKLSFVVDKNFLY